MCVYKDPSKEGLAGVAAGRAAGGGSGHSLSYLRVAGRGKHATKASCLFGRRTAYSSSIPSLQAGKQEVQTSLWKDWQLVTRAVTRLVQSAAAADQSE